MSETTLGAAVAEAARRLRGAGIEDARREARLLLQAATGADGLAVLAHPDRAVGAAAADLLAELVARRCRREPMAQVLGLRGFWEHDFVVTAATLTPRPETELLVEVALRRAGPAEAPRRVLDLGTGTGCLLLTLLKAWPNAWGLGVDRSTVALAVAHENAGRLRLLARAAFVAGDWCTAIGGVFDVIVANPPYIATDDIAALEPEVARHEPRLALDGGVDGLAAYRRLLPGLGAILAPDGIVALEHGAGQRAALSMLAGEAGLEVADALDDLAGQDRALVLASPGGDKRPKKGLE